MPNTMTQSESLTETERRFVVERAEHSGELEGLPIDPATRADAYEWVAGRIDIEEFMARVLVRDCRS